MGGTDVHWTGAWSGTLCSRCVTQCVSELKPALTTPPAPARSSLHGKHADEGGVKISSARSLCKQKKRFLVFEFWLPFRGPEMAPLFWPFDNNYLFWRPFLAPKMGAVFGPQNGAQGGGADGVTCEIPASDPVPFVCLWEPSGQFPPSKVWPSAC